MIGIFMKNKEKIKSKGERHMREKMDQAYLRVMAELEDAVQNFAAEERGASDIVTVIILIAIVIAAAVIFRGALLSFVQKIMDQLNNF